MRDVGRTFNIPDGNAFIGSTIPCKGNGMTLGLTDGTNNAGIRWASGNATLNQDSTNYGANIGTGSTSKYNAVSKVVGITTDPTKSGIVADLSSGMSAVIKY